MNFSRGFVGEIKDVTADRRSRIKFLAGCLLISLGISMAAGGGSWDITNHLLNKPETFFSLPHAILYAGVGSAVTGTIIMFSGWRSIGVNNAGLRTVVKLAIMGIALLLAAGPVDFVWHSAFGLDGLLSPPHFALLMGMMMSSIGALFGIGRYYSIMYSPTGTGRNHTPFVLTVIGIVPVWMTASGFIYMFSLPFSNTQYFDFNPDPTFAIVLATLSLPFLISLILCSSFELAGRRFGVLSTVGAVFVAIHTGASIVPNESLIQAIPFYMLTIIPMVVADAIMSVFRKHISAYVAGSLLGVSFFMLYYPLITHVYNEGVVWPSLTSSTYFGMIGHVYPLAIIPAVVMGILGNVFGSKFVRTLTLRS